METLDDLACLGIGRPMERWIFFGSHRQEPSAACHIHVLDMADGSCLECSYCSDCILCMCACVRAFVFGMPAPHASRIRVRIDAYALATRVGSWRWAAASVRLNMLLNRRDMPCCPVIWQTLVGDFLDWVETGKNPFDNDVSAALDYDE